MLPPPNPNSSYVDVLKRMTRRAKQSGVDEQILDMMQKVFENGLVQENIVLSRPERKRLLRQITEAVFNDVLENMGGAKK